MPFNPVFITRELKVFTDKEVLFSNSAGIAFLVEVIFTMQSNYLYSFLLSKKPNTGEIHVYFPRLLHQFPVFVCKNFSAGDSYIYSDCILQKFSSVFQIYHYIDEAKKSKRNSTGITTLSNTTAREQKWHYKTT